MSDLPSSPASVSPETPTVDLFLSYNSQDRSYVEQIRAQLQAREITTFFDRESLLPGMPWAHVLQREVGRARAVVVFLGKDGLGAWQKREMWLALDRQAAEERSGRAFPVVPVLLPGADLETAPGFLLLNTWVDLRRVDDPTGLDALVRVVLGEPPPGPVPPPPAISPYLGLRAFREEDAPLYFGRDAFARQLFEKVHQHPLTAVVSASGSGKSSLVQAGLLPLLRREIPPQPTWDAVVFTPGKRPFHSLAATLVRIWNVEGTETDRLTEAERLGTSLASGELPLSSAVARALEHLWKEKVDRLLLVVDQFEELFTQTPEEAVRRSFMDELLRAVESQPVHAVLTLRADFYGQSISLGRELSDRLQQGQVNLGSMTREELQQAIEEPAKAVGLQFDDGLVERILAGVSDQPGNLPLLEYALTELWNRREGRFLTHRAYDAIGRVEGAISQRADQELDRWSPERQQRLLRELARLVRVDATTEEGTDTRQRVRLSELDPAAQEMVRSFADARLLVMSRNEATNEEIVEVAHEALIRNWPQLRKLLNEDRAFFVWRQRLQSKLEEWKAANRDSELLLKGAPLQEARRWARARAGELNGAEREFIRRSVQAATSRKTQGMVLKAAVALLIAVSGAWFAYSRTDWYQVSRILAQAPDILPEAADSTAGRWYRALVLSGRTDSALTEARQIDAPAWRSSALVAVASALAEAGQRQEAAHVAQEALAASRQIEELYRSAEALVRVASALTEAGQRQEAAHVAQEALAAAQQIEDPVARASALTAVARALAQVGQRQEARRAVFAADSAALRIVAREERSSRLSEVAQVFAELGLFRPARVIADRREVSDDGRLNAYATILLGYTKKRNPGIAERPGQKPAGLDLPPRRGPPTPPPAVHSPPPAAAIPARARP